MNQLRKIPLEMLIQILQELYDGGADFVDISGDSSEEGQPLRDTIKLTVKPEYLSDFDGDNDEEATLGLEQEIEMNFTDDEEPSTGLSDSDIEDLI